MKNRIIKIMVGVFLLFFVSIVIASENTPNTSVPDKTQAKVLLLHSYHPEYEWVSAITSGVKEALAGQNIELEIFYMDTKRQTSQQWKLQAGNKAKQKIDAWQPDVVIAADDNAQIYVTRRYAGKYKPFFVFCGLNGTPEDYDIRASNVTGILERPRFNDSIEYLRQIVPNTKRIAVIGDDGPSSTNALDFIQTCKTKIKVLGYHIIGTVDQWRQRFAQYEVDADAVCIYAYHTVKDSNSVTSMEPAVLLKETLEDYSIPTVGFFDFAIEDGMLCGVVEDGHEHGYEAAQMALELIKGTDISKLPIKTAVKGKKLINLKTAEKLGITIPQEIIDSADEVIR